MAIIDTAVVAATLLAAPVLVWPMAMAIPASLTRSTLVLRSLSRSRPR